MLNQCALSRQDGHDKIQPGIHRAWIPAGFAPPPRARRLCTHRHHIPPNDVHSMIHPSCISCVFNDVYYFCGCIGHNRWPGGVPAGKHQRCLRASRKVRPGTMVGVCPQGAREARAGAGCALRVRGGVRLPAPPGPPAPSPPVPVGHPGDPSKSRGQSHCMALIVMFFSLIAFSAVFSFNCVCSKILSECEMRFAIDPPGQRVAVGGAEPSTGGALAQPRGTSLPNRRRGRWPRGGVPDEP